MGAEVGLPEFFQVESSVVAEPSETWNGADALITVRFEPEAVGEVRDTLKVKSAEGGSYLRSLFGVGEPPRPQGPVDVSVGGQAVITFKNTFSESYDFTISCDNERFSADTSATIAAKASKEIVVKCAEGDLNHGK